MPDFVCLFIFFSLYIAQAAYSRLFGQSSNQLAQVTEYIQSDIFFVVDSVIIILTSFKINQRNFITSVFDIIFFFIENYQVDKRNFYVVFMKHLQRIEF